MQPQQPAAVCVTGESRSFAEIGHNVREGVLLLLGSPAIRFFGVRPEHDRWELLQAILPFEEVALQQPCWSTTQLNWTKSWLHCDMRQRKHDCRASFLQQLCDMQQCSAMITTFEAKQAVQFHRIARIRPDIYWEARVVVPAALWNSSVYMPKGDAQGGVNDHMAFGMRAPMLRYLGRIRHAHHNLADIKHLRGRTGEYHLKLSLQRDGVTPTLLSSWATCMHTYRALLGPMSSGYRGCVGRARCRTRCVSLICKQSGFWSGECECFNETCATLATGVSHTDSNLHARFVSPRKTHARRVGVVSQVPVATIPLVGNLTAFGGRFRRLAIRAYGTFGVPFKRQSHRQVKRSCVDVGQGAQLFHPLPCRAVEERRAALEAAGNARGSASSSCGSCPWPRHPSGQPVQYATLENLPKCVLDQRGAEYRAPPTGVQCALGSITRKVVFAGQNPILEPNATGFWPRFTRWWDPVGSTKPRRPGRRPTRRRTPKKRRG